MTKIEEFLHKWRRQPYDKQIWIPVTDMILGNYICYARNFSVGYWNGEVFEYTRTKFGSSYPDIEYHWDIGAPFGTCKPLKYLGDKYGD